MTTDATFDGKPRHLDEFLLRIEAHIDASRTLRADSRAAAAFILSKLEGDAIIWATEAKRRNPTILASRTGLVEALKKHFEWTTDAQKARAAHRIKNCRQGRRSVLSYHLEFSGYANVLGWDDAAQIAAFQDGLSPQIKKAIVTAGKTFTDLGELAKEASRLDTELFASGSGFGNLSMGGNRGRRSGRSFSGKCHNCGQFGHKAANCRRKQSGN